MVGRIGAIGRMMGRVGAASPVKGVGGAYKTLMTAGDSLTAGSTSYEPYITRLMADLGDANIKSLIVDLSPNTARNATQPYITAALTGSGINPVSGQNMASVLRQRSVEGFGAFTLATASGAAITLTSTRAWTSAEVFFLTDANASSPYSGSARVRCSSSASYQTASGLTSPLVDLGSGYGLAKVTVEVDPAASNPLQLVLDTWTGRFCAYLVRFNFQPSGHTLYNPAISGLALGAASAPYNFSNLIQLDATAQAAWMQLLGVTDIVLNIGTNDRLGDAYPNAATFRAGLNTVTGRYITGGVAGARIRLLEPCQVQDGATDKYRQGFIDAAADIGGLYVDQRLFAGTVLGLTAGSRATYNQMNTASYMFDTLHPNTSWNRLLGSKIKADVFG